MCAHRQHSERHFPMALSFKPRLIIISDTIPDRKRLKACQDYSRGRIAVTRNDSHPDPLKTLQRAVADNFRLPSLCRTIYIAITL